MKTDTRVITAICPDCEMEILLESTPQKGDRVDCENCWAALIITSLEPLELDWEIEEFDEEDWKEE